MENRICKCGHSIDAHPPVEHCTSSCVVPGCKCIAYQDRGETGAVTETK